MLACPACAVEIPGPDLGPSPGPFEPNEAPPCPACGHGQWFRVEREAGARVVLFRGRGLVTEQNVMRVLERAREMIVDQGADRLVLDFDGVSYISSTILGRLVALHRLARDRGTALALCSLRPELHDVVRLARLEDILPLYPDRAGALGSLA